MVPIEWSGCEWLPCECKNAHFQALPLLTPSVITWCTCLYTESHMWFFSNFNIVRRVGQNRISIIIGIIWYGTVRRCAPPLCITRRIYRILRINNRYCTTYIRGICAVLICAVCNMSTADSGSNPAGTVLLLFGVNLFICAPIAPPLLPKHSHCSPLSFNARFATLLVV
jgi:hypothetical protein